MLAYTDPRRWREASRRSGRRITVSPSPARAFFSAPRRNRAPTPLVGIAVPDYPEWANSRAGADAGLPQLVSHATAKKRRYRWKPSAVPNGEEQSAVVKGAQLIVHPADTSASTGIRL